MLSDDEVARIARDVFRHTAGSDPVEVEARSAQDFDGTPIIRVTARYRRRPVGASYRGLDPMHDIRSALLERNEERFVFLQNIYDDVIDPEVDDAA